MKSICSCALVVALALTCACAPRVNDPADIQAVRKSVEDFAKAMNAGDAEGVISVMTETIVFADNHIPVVVGRSAIKPIYDAQFGMFTAAFQAPVEEVRVVGDQAVSRGTWSVTLTPKVKELAPITDGGSWMLLSTRQPDGSWKWDWLLPNSNRPMPGTTADGAEEQAIVKIEQDWVAALARSDLAFLDRNLAPEYMDSADGQAVSKAQLVAALKSGAFKFESVTLRDLSVHVFGYVAIATSTVEVKATYRGQPIPPLQRSTDVFVKRDGRWQAISTQNVTIK